MPYLSGGISTASVPQPIMVETTGNGTTAYRKSLAHCKPLRPRHCTHDELSKWRRLVRDATDQTPMAVIQRGQQMPTVKQITEQNPALSFDDAVAIADARSEPWKEANTAFYHLLREGIDLSGPWSDSDERMIEDKWVSQENELRDGLSLYQWACSFKPIDSIEVQ